MVYQYHSQQGPHLSGRIAPNKKTLIWSADPNWQVQPWGAVSVTSTARAVHLTLPFAAALILLKFCLGGCPEPHNKSISFLLRIESCDSPRDIAFKRLILKPWMHHLHLVRTRSNKLPWPYLCRRRQLPTAVESLALLARLREE
jgi:hypothetical protein